MERIRKLVYIGTLISCVIPLTVYAQAIEHRRWDIRAQFRLRGQDDLIKAMNKAGFQWEEEQGPGGYLSLEGNYRFDSWKSVGVGLARFTVDDHAAFSYSFGKFTVDTSHGGSMDFVGVRRNIWSISSFVGLHLEEEENVRLKVGIFSSWITGKYCCSSNGTRNVVNVIRPGYLVGLDMAGPKRFPIFLVLGFEYNQTMQYKLGPFQVSYEYWSEGKWNKRLRSSKIAISPSYRMLYLGLGIRYYLLDYIIRKIFGLR